MTVELPIGLLAPFASCDQMRPLDLSIVPRLRRTNSSMSVPSSTARPMARASSAAPQPDPSRRKVRVLLVDDNSVALRLLTTLCERHGYAEWLSRLD